MRFLLWWYTKGLKNPDPLARFTAMLITLWVVAEIIMVIVVLVTPEPAYMREAHQTFFSNFFSDMQ